MTTEQFIIPEYYLSYLINTDASGLTDDEQIKIDQWQNDMMQSNGYECFIAVETDNEPYFSWTNDVDNLGSNVCKVTFITQP